METEGVTRAFTNLITLGDFRIFRGMFFIQEPCFQVFSLGHFKY